MPDIEHIRKDFPQLKNGTLHYLDSAATSLTPMPVIESVDEYYFDYRANVHRGMFREALKATERYEGARRKVATFIGATGSNEVIFTGGATDSSNMFVRMLEESGMLKGKTNIVTTVMEHHASLIPLQQLAKRTGLELRHIPMHDLELDYEAAASLITDETALVSVIHASNVTGMINDVARIARLAHEHKAIMVSDVTASMGHIEVNAGKLGVDALYFSGHKMFAPTGIGVLWVAMPLLERLEPSFFGGHMIARVENDTATWAPIPERFEGGTKDISGAIGLGVAIDYLSDVGIDVIHAHTAMLTFTLIRKLEQMEGVKVFSPCDVEKNVGMASFTADWAHPHDIAEVLARDGVAVRPGHHCAIPLHTALGVAATTRASLHVYNSKDDVDALIRSLEQAKKIFVN